MNSEENISSINSENCLEEANPVSSNQENETFIVHHDLSYYLNLAPQLANDSNFLNQTAEQTDLNIDNSAEEQKIINFNLLSNQKKMTLFSIIENNTLKYFNQLNFLVRNISDESKNLHDIREQLHGFLQEFHGKFYFKL